MVTRSDRRVAVEHLQRDFSMTQRRACRLISQPRSSQRYRHHRPSIPGLRERLVSLAQERRRFGYPRLHMLLRREGSRRRGSASLRIESAPLAIVRQGSSAADDDVDRILWMRILLGRRRRRLGELHVEGAESNRADGVLAGGTGDLTRASGRTKKEWTCSPSTTRCASSRA